VFPLLVGTLAQSVGIARSYWFSPAAGLLAGALVARARKGRVEGRLGLLPDERVRTGS
jgi:hypothetical protein